MTGIVIPAELAEVARRLARIYLADCTHDASLLGRTKGRAHPDHIRAIERLQEAIRFKAAVESSATDGARFNDIDPLIFAARLEAELDRDAA